MLTHLLYGKNLEMHRFVNLFIICMAFPFILLAQPRTVTVLSIDGGGIRGIIPALVLKELETRLNKKTNAPRHISSYFDVMSGTSTGGIISLLLNVTNDKGEPLYNPNHVVEFYTHFGQKAFKTSVWHKIISLGGWAGDKYVSSTLEDLLSKYFGDASLKDTYSNVIIPSFDAAQQKMLFFSTMKAEYNSSKNYYLKDIARATSAAPTYFPPAIIRNIDQTVTNIMIDGGIAANNPALCACVHAVDLYGKDIDLVVVSLGTGSVMKSETSILSKHHLNLKDMGIIDWAPLIIPMMMDSDTDMVDYQMQHVVGKNYFRLQIEMDQYDASLDDTDLSNIERLEKYAKELIVRNDEIIDQVVEVLVSNK